MVEFSPSLIPDRVRDGDGTLSGFMLASW